MNNHDNQDGFQQQGYSQNNLQNYPHNQQNNNQYPQQNFQTPSIEEMTKFIEDTKNKINRAEGKLETLENQYKQLLSQLDQMGVPANSIHDEIARLEQENNMYMNEINQLYSTINEKMSQMSNAV